MLQAQSVNQAGAVFDLQYWQSKWGQNKREIIPGPVADESLAGRGLHQITKGGFLNIHVEFTSHPMQTHWARRINLRFYLDKNWQEEYGSHLEL